MQHTPVLYAEDDEDDIFFMQVAWEKAAVSNPLITVKDGKQAMQYLMGEGAFADRQQYPAPCLLLLDLKLPIVTGFEVLQWLRGNPALKDLKVVIVSSSGQQLDIDLARKIGIQDYMAKPGVPGRLVEIVRALKERWLPPLRPTPKSARGCEFHNKSLESLTSSRHGFLPFSKAV